MWLKIKVWTKIIVGSILALYALLFIYNNTGKQVEFWWWFSRPTSASVFTLAVLAFVSGVVAAILVRTTWKTYAQIRELQRRSRQQRVERDIADMKSKAGMLKTRQQGFPVTPSASSTSAEPIEDIDDPTPPAA